MNKISTPSLNIEDKERLQQERNRIELRLRIGQGAKKLIEKPILNLFPVSLGIASFLAWKKSSDFLLNSISDNGILSPASNKLLLQIYKYAPSVAISLIFLLLLAWLLKLLGTPFKARGIQDSLLGMKTNFTDSFHCPFLLSYKQNKQSKEITMIFYSKWISISRWIEFQEQIADALSIQLTEDIKRGKGKHRIVLTGVPNTIVDYSPINDADF